MSQDLPPPPQNVPMIDDRDMPVITPIWSDWFKKAFVRMGGHFAPTNNDLITTDRIADAAVTSAKIALAGVASSNLAAAAVNPTALASSVAGSGLTGGAGSALAVQVDNSTLEVASSVVRAKDSGITFAKLLSTDWANSKLSGGYQKIGSGLIIQWGITGSLSSASTTTVGYATTFPTAALQVIAGINGNPAGVTTATGQWGTGNYTTTGFDLYNRTSAAYSFSWIAVGY